jgi:hypothetical protein
MAQTYTLLATTEFGVPSDNYDGSSLNWYSDPVQSADYYRGRGSMQTITFELNNFRGRCVVEATLDTDSDNATWFDTYTIGDPVVPLTDRHPETIIGNFVWIRIRVELFESGTIEYINITY